MVWKTSLALNSRMKWQQVHAISQRNMVVRPCISVGIICVFISITFIQVLSVTFLPQQMFYDKVYKCSAVLLLFICCSVAHWVSTSPPTTIIIISLLSPLCRIFTIVYLQPTMFLCCSFSVFRICATCNFMFCLWNMFCTSTLALSVACVQYQIWLFFTVL